MDGLGQAHQRRGNGTGQRTAYPSDGLKVWAQGKEFAYPNTNYTGNELADDGISWLRQWRLNGIEMQDRPGTLIIHR